MRTITTLAALALAAATAAPGAMLTSSLNVTQNVANEDVATAPEPDFSFLEGVWVGELGGTVIEEVWMPGRHGNMTGCLRRFDEAGAITMYELFTIGPGEGGPVFRIRHFDGEMTPWASEADGPMVFNVEPGEGSARIIPAGEDSSVEYGEFHAVDDTLTFRLVFKGDRPPLEIRYERP